MSSRMKRKLILFIIGLYCFSISSQAQTKSVATVQQIWTGYFNQARFSNKWGSWIDLQLRTKEDFFTDFSVSIVRGGLTYYLNDVTKLTVGDAWINFFPGDNHKGVSQPEHRPWQQIQWHTNYAKTKSMQLLRLEQRFRRKILNDSTLAEGNSFNFRLRYNFLFQVPLNGSTIKKGDFSFILNNEVQINFGKQVVYNTFDQNRFFIGFAYHVNPKDNLQFGYLNVFQQMASGSSYRDTHAARIYYYHNLDLRKKG